MNDRPPPQEERGRGARATHAAAATAATAAATRKIAVPLFVVAVLVVLALVVTGLVSPSGTTGFFYVALVFVGFGSWMLLLGGLIAVRPRSLAAARGGLTTTAACAIIIEALGFWYLLHLVSDYGGFSVSTGQATVVCAAAVVTVACGIGSVVAVWRLPGR